MRRTLTISLDFDWLWRVLFYRGVGTMLKALATAGSNMEADFRAWVLSLRDVARRHLGFVESNRDYGIFARTWQIGTTALWIAILLSVYVLTYFVS